MNENEIQNLDFLRWESKNISISAPKDKNNESGKIEWELKPTYKGVALRIQDLMVLRIINDNSWVRPIYFGVTVSPTSMLNLDDYLTMEGLAYRLVNNSNEVINQDRMSENLLEFVGDTSWFDNFDSKIDLYDNNISKDYQTGFIYRNLANENVYVDPQLGRLVQNYRTGFVRLAIAKYLQENLEQTEVILLKMEEIMPSKVIPISSKQLQYQIALLYNKLGNKNKMKYHLNELVQRKDLELEDYIKYGSSYMQFLNDYHESKLIFESIYNNYEIIERSISKKGFTATKISPNEWKEWQQSLPEIVSLLFLSYQNLEMYDEAKILLENCFKRNPSDDNAKNLLNEILQSK